MTTPKDLLYSKTHEWVRKNDDGTVTIGITEFAAKLIGDIVYISFELDPDEESEKGEPFAEIESVKAVESSFAPINGTVLEVNEALEDDYTVVTNAAFTDGWLMKVKPSNLDELKELMDSSAYEAFCQAEKH